MNEEKNCLVLTQYRQGDQYNDFIGKFYHFPSNDAKNYLGQFEKLPIEFIYYEPTKQGEGVFYGYGRINKQPFIDKRDSGNSFVEIAEYKPFSTPVPYKNAKGELIEKLNNAATYNANNAVRKISQHFLDNICLEGGIILNFKADAHLIKILGEQLIGSEKVGILELVKNAIDANASYCRVRFEKLPGMLNIPDTKYEFNELDGPVIVIEDDGVGMSRDVIENGWLRPASTIKTSIKEKLKLEREKAEKSGKLASYNAVVAQIKKENGGRIPLGEKGVGRFATHRLGRHLIIRTKTSDIDFEYMLEINWDDFDCFDGKYKDLDAIAVKLTKQNISRDYGKNNSGTQIIIFGGRNEFALTEDGIRDINKSILRLNPPNSSTDPESRAFHAYVECPQIEDLETAEVYEKFIPTFSLDASVDHNGIVKEYVLKFTPPNSVPLPKRKWEQKNFDLKVSEPRFWKDSSGDFRQPKCGAFKIHIDAWYRVKPWIDGLDSKDMIDYLSDYGGISIYRDNVIIFPAESGTKHDWLKLSQRHIKQNYRISYYNMIGCIKIDQSENLSLIDKTNREGMVENQAYHDLSKLTETIIQNILEIKYIAIRDDYTNLTKDLIRDPKKLNNVAHTSSIIIEGVEKNYPIESDPWGILAKLGNSIDERKAGLVNLNSSIKNLKKSIEIIENVQDKLAEHAGFGLAAAVSLHELNKITTNFYHGVSHLIDSGDVTKLKLEDLRTISASLRSELKRLGPLRTIRNEALREFNISQSIKYVWEIFKLKCEEENISFGVNLDSDFKIYARYSTMNQILVNLFDNSIYWLASVHRNNRKIRIFLSAKLRTLIFADSGVGIDEAIRPYLFEPGYSMKVPPSGLGLYVCKSYMNAIGGGIYETSMRERLNDMNGAQFTIDFERVPEAKEL